MFRIPVTDRLSSRAALILACTGLYICGVVVLSTEGAGADANNPPPQLAQEPPMTAPTGFTNVTNGFEPQGDFDNDRATFEEVETILPQKADSTSATTSGGDGRQAQRRPRLSASTSGSSDSSSAKSGGGLGPVYNATSCVSCHQNPVTGSSSQVSEIRAGHHEPAPIPGNANNFIFIEPCGGSLIHQRAIDAQIQEHVLPQGEEARTLRMSNTILGNGFVEVIQDQQILDVQETQPAEMKGLAILVPVAVRVREVVNGQPSKFHFVLRIGRFGWKCQEASLLNFSANAYINEIGITSPLQPTENKSNGRDVTQFDPVADPEDPAIPQPDLPPDAQPMRHEDFLHPFGNDVEAFTRFMRSTRTPPGDFCLTQVCQNDADDVAAGEKLFKGLGCAICHHPEFKTDAAGTPIKLLPQPPPDGPLPGTDFNKGMVPPALGNKVVRPFSDFMLHDVGTGDGIVQTQHAQFPPRGAEEFLQRARQVLRGPQRPAAFEKYKVHIVGGPTEKDLSGVDRRRLQDLITCGARDLDQSTATMIRTAPLWGLRVRPQLMHDGMSLTIEEAIVRHSVQAEAVKQKFMNLRKNDPKAADQLITFLNSL